MTYSLLDLDWFSLHLVFDFLTIDSVINVGIACMASQQHVCMYLRNYPYYGGDLERVKADVSYYFDNFRGQFENWKFTRRKKEVAEKVIMKVCEFDYIMSLKYILDVFNVADTHSRILLKTSVLYLTQHGHVNLLRFLHREFVLTPEDCVRYRDKPGLFEQKWRDEAIEWACQYEHVEIVKFFHEEVGVKEPESWNDWCFRAALQNEKTDRIVKYFCEDLNIYVPPEVFGWYTADSIVENCSTLTLQYFYVDRGVRVPVDGVGDLFRCASKGSFRGRIVKPRDRLFGLLKKLLDEHTDCLDRRDILFGFSQACAHGQFKSVKYLVEKCEITISEIRQERIFVLAPGYAVGNANEEDYCLMAQFLVDHFKLTAEDVRAGKNLTLAISCMQGFLKLTKFLVKTFKLTRNDFLLADVNHSVFAETCSNGELEMVKYLCQTFELTKNDIRNIEDRNPEENILLKAMLAENIDPDVFAREKKSLKQLHEQQEKVLELVKWLIDFFGFEKEDLPPNLPVGIGDDQPGHLACQWLAQKFNY